MGGGFVFREGRGNVADRGCISGLWAGQATMGDVGEVEVLYDAVVAANSGTRYDVRWDRDSHPSDAAIEAAARAGELYIARLDGEVAGACLLDRNFAPGYEDVPWRCAVPLAESRCLHLFCIHPDLQGRGLAAAFLRGLLDLMRAQGVDAVRLDVFDYNLPARRLYEKVGFTLAATTFLSYDDQDVSHIPFAMYEIALG